MTQQKTTDPLIATGTALRKHTLEWILKKSRIEDRTPTAYMRMILEKAEREDKSK